MVSGSVCSHMSYMDTLCHLKLEEFHSEIPVREIDGQDISVLQVDVVSSILAFIN